MVWAAFSTWPTMALRRAALYCRVTQEGNNQPAEDYEGADRNKQLALKAPKAHGACPSAGQVLVHLSQIVIPFFLGRDKPVNHQFRQDLFAFRVLVHGEQNLPNALFGFDREVLGSYQGRDTVRFRFLDNPGFGSKGWVLLLVKIPNQSVHRGAVHQVSGHRHDGIIMAISIDDAAEEGFRLLMHFCQPVSGHQPAGIGIGIGEGKGMPFKFFQAMNRGFLY